jgi:hypothetical protein
VFVALEGASLANRRFFVIVSIVSIVLLAALGPSVTASAAPSSQWVRPVAGAVVRPFDAPRSRFGAGHLGVDLAAAPGTAVHAAGPGVVSFAGSVAGGLHVVVAHAGDLRTSYSFLASIAVRRGERVAPGDVVGATGGSAPGHDGTVVHFGLRSGDTYVDPMLLLQPIDLATVVHLAPTTDPPRAASGTSERRGLVAGLVHRAGAVVHAAGTVLAAGGRVAGTALADGRDALVAAGSGIRRFAASRFPMQAAVARGLATWWAQRGHCDAHAPAADGTGGSNHRVMIVAGIDSSITNGGPSSALPAHKLGYAASEVSYFSYAPDGGDYAAADTEGSLVTAARRLGAQLRALQRREPGREVDLLGHSQGGVVVEEFLTHVYNPSDPSYPPLGTAVAMASPLSGATGATVFDRLRRSSAGREALNAARAAGLPNPNAESVAELSKHSNFMRAQAETRLPAMVQLTTIGAAQDVVAPAGDTAKRGAQRYTAIPNGLNGHSSIVTDASALRAARAALEGRPLPCQSLASTLTGEILSTAIATAEQRIGAVATLATSGTGR